MLREIQALRETAAARRIRLPLGAVIIAAAAVLAPGAQAQTSTAPEPPAGAAPTPAHTAPDIQPPPTASSGTGTAVAPAPIFLNHPTVVDTAHLKGNDTVVTLFGIQGWAGDPALGLQSFVTANGDRVTCRPHDGGNYTCMVPTGLDVAATALANGVAQTMADAPADYRRQEADAQAAHLGIWAGLPPAPVVIRHPLVETTADLAGNGGVFPLAGVIGFSAPYYTLQLQNYIKAHGDQVSCEEKSASGSYVCVLPDGTDVATVALLAGLARVGPNAPQAYRADEAKAVASKSGYWFETPHQAVTDLSLPPYVPVCCNYEPAEIGDGITYDNGLAVAVVDNEPVFFGYSDLLGFGFFDEFHRFHPAPERFRAHLERFHPRGQGLPGFGDGAAPHQAAAFREPGLPGPARPDVFNGPDVAHGLANANPAAMVHNPVVLGPPQIRGPETFSHELAFSHEPIGTRPGLVGGMQVHRPVIARFAAPQPAFAGGFHPGIARVPGFAAPPIGFVGRH